MLIQYTTHIIQLQRISVILIIPPHPGRVSWLPISISPHKPQVLSLLLIDTTIIITCTVVVGIVVIFNTEMIRLQYRG
jgi:hypothetical protein